jgi:hypothetical protein
MEDFPRIRQQDAQDSFFRFVLNFSGLTLKWSAKQGVCGRGHCRRFAFTTVVCSLHFSCDQTSHLWYFCAVLTVLACTSMPAKWSTGVQRQQAALLTLIEHLSIAVSEALSVPIWCALLHNVCSSLADSIAFGSVCTGSRTLRKAELASECLPNCCLHEVCSAVQTASHSTRSGL